MKIILTESKIKDLAYNYIKDQFDEVLESSKGLYDLILIKKDGKTVFEVSNDDGLIGVAGWFWDSLMNYFNLSDVSARHYIIKVMEETFGRDFNGTYVMRPYT